MLGYDTDSVWYIERIGGEAIETGDSLGDLTDELDGNYVTDWCGTGPNRKVKGFTLNYENSQYINQESMKQLIKEEKKRITIVNENKITEIQKQLNIKKKFNTWI